MSIETARCHEPGFFKELTVQGVKETINYIRGNGVFPGLVYVAQKNAAASSSDDLMAAVNAFMEKRDPMFKGQ